MADRKIESLMKAQLKRDEFRVRDMARRLGVNYAATPDVRSRMDAANIDKVEIADCLCRSILKEIFVMFGFTRYRVEPEELESGDRITSVTVGLHADSETIEIIAFREKENQQ